MHREAILKVLEREGGERGERGDERRNMTGGDDGVGKAGKQSGTKSGISSN